MKKIKLYKKTGFLIALLGFNPLYAGEIFSISDPTVIQTSAVNTSLEKEDFQARVLSTSIVSSLRSEYKNKAQQQAFDSCVVSEARDRQGVATEALGVLCFLASKPNLDGVSFIYDGSAKQLIVTSIKSSPEASRRVDQILSKKGEGKEGKNSLVHPNPCKEIDTRGVGLVPLPLDLKFNLLKDMKMSSLEKKDGGYLSTILSHEDFKSAEAELKQYGLQATNVLLHISKGSAFSSSTLCVACPANSSYNGFDCIRGSCSVFESNCQAPQTCTEDEVRVGNQCITSCAARCTNLSRHVMSAAADNANKYNKSKEKDLDIHGALGLERPSTEQSSIDTEDFDKLRRKLFSDLLFTLGRTKEKCEQMPAVDLCGRIPVFKATQDAFLLEDYSRCSKDGGLYNRETKSCDPVSCYLCPQLPLYTGPLAIAGCSYSETQMAVNRLQVVQYGDGCKKGTCVEKIITEEDVKNYMARIGLLCIRNTPAIYGTETKAQPRARSRGSK